ncbi:unnamed protein product [Polarella glacialis]|uniref:Glutaredoxin domain-containing protein n=1 Tax=Polarella glacialis TaxID=89957 RepID=A0A813F0L1_POLGL|nr:unnamed protein product [Polarella glacialis]
MASLLPSSSAGCSWARSRHTRSLAKLGLVLAAYSLLPQSPGRVRVADRGARDALLFACGDLRVVAAARGGRVLMHGALSDAAQVDDLAQFCSKVPERKQAAVYAVFAADGQAQYVGIARDVHSALLSHLAMQPAGECAKVAIETFERPSRDAMAAVQGSWIAELGSVPVGNSDSEQAASWSKPPMSPEASEKKLKMRQASADGSLQQDDPEAWRSVVQKAMKDGDFDGSEADSLDASIAADAKSTARRAALKRAAGDWQGEIEAQTADALAGAGRQVPTLEMYSAAGCPHCDKMRARLTELGAKFTEYNIEAEETGRDDEVTRRARHARFNTVPQLYVLRQPPLRGRSAERLVGGSDDLELEVRSERFQAELWE